MIRHSTKDDCNKIAELLFLSFSAYEHLYTKKAYQVTIASPEIVLKRIEQGACWVYESKNEIAGTLSSKITEEGLYIYGMAVHPQFRKQKIGWNLLKEAERSSKQNGISRMYLSTTPFLMEAIHLYENFRFLKTSHPPFELYHTPLFTMERNAT